MKSLQEYLMETASPENYEFSNEIVTKCATAIRDYCYKQIDSYKEKLIRTYWELGTEIEGYVKVDNNFKQMLKETVDKMFEHANYEDLRIATHSPDSDWQERPRDKWGPFGGLTTDESASIIKKYVNKLDFEGNGEEFWPFPDSMKTNWTFESVCGLQLQRLLENVVGFQNDIKRIQTSYGMVDIKFGPRVNWGLTYSVTYMRFKPTK